MLRIFKSSVVKTINQLPIFINKTNIRLTDLKETNVKQEIANIRNNVVQNSLNKVHDINNWYIRTTGLDEVRQSQDRVIQNQCKLEEAQEARRAVGRHLNEIRKQCVNLQEELHKVKRWEDTDRFLTLTQEETDIIKLEKEIQKKFEELDKTEREIFTSLINSVRDSHEKERAQVEYTKYWGIILSIIGTIIGAVASLILSTIRTQQLVDNIHNKLSENVLNKFIYENNEMIQKSMTDNLTHLIKISKNNTSTEQNSTEIFDRTFKIGLTIIGLYIFLRLIG